MTKFYHRGWTVTFKVLIVTQAGKKYHEKTNTYDILINNGKNKIDLDISEYFNLLKKKPIGELLLNSIDRDGTGFGFDFEILKSVKNFNIPIIFQGGVGNAKHLLEGFKNKYIDAAATANLLNF